MADTAPPTVAISSPTGGAIKGMVTVNINASDNMGVARVDLYVDGAKVQSDSTAPYAFSWNSRDVAGGLATLTAYCYDAAGNLRVSAPVAVTINSVATGIRALRRVL